MAKRQSGSDYWKGRFSALEDERYGRSEAYYKDVKEQFRRAANGIQMDVERWYGRLAENNGISYAGAKRLLKKGELEEFRWTVEQYIKVGEENAVSRRWVKELENASARHHVSYLEAMKVQVQHYAELLSTEYEGGITDFLHKCYADQYYHTAYELARGTGVGSNLAALDLKQVDVLIKRPWAQDGANFSDRIWANKQKLVTSLHTELAQSIIRGEPPQKAIEALARTMNVSKGQAGRLVVTESAAISSAAQKDCLKELGVERYEILATLDGLTSEICREMDGKVFAMKEYEVGLTAPPFHPNCRTTTVPYFEDEFMDGEERAARNEETGETYYVPAKMKYPEWKKEYVTMERGIDKNVIKSYNMPKGADLSGWRQKAVDTNPEEDAVLANINFHKGPKYQVNCQRCVPAYEMRRRGYDVTAKSAVIDGDDPIEKSWVSVFENAKWKRCLVGSGQSQIEEAMASFGEGARAEVYVIWEDSFVAHAFVAEQRGGKTVFIDPQNGKTGVDWYFSHVAPGETRMCRMDDLGVTDDIFECCEGYKR